MGIALADLVGHMSDKDYGHAWALADMLNKYRHITTGSTTIKRDGKHVSGPVTNSDIRNALKKLKGIDVSDAKLRQLIAYVRHTGLVRDLCGSNSGYYFAKDTAEFQKYTEALYARIMAIMYSYHCLKKHTSFETSIEMDFYDALFITADEHYHRDLQRFRP